MHLQRLGNLYHHHRAGHTSPYALLKVSKKVDRIREFVSVGKMILKTIKNSLAVLHNIFKDAMRMEKTLEVHYEQQKRALGDVHTALESPEDSIYSYIIVFARTRTLRFYGS